MKVRILLPELWAVGRIGNPSAKPDVDEARARMNAQLGRADAAIPALEQLLSAYYQKSFFGSTLTPALLKLDPVWDPIRADPRFQKLVALPNP